MPNSEQILTSRLLQPGRETRIRQLSMPESRHRLDLKTLQATSALRHAVSKGENRWFITYSGGKDSTTVIMLALELAKKGVVQPQQIDIVYADTMLEIPPLRENAIDFLRYVVQFSKDHSLPVHCHVVQPNVDESFWFCLLGKGYPPPHQRFRWCTRRLKIQPARRLIDSTTRTSGTCVITGVRFNESKNRDHQLRLACRRGGECGQGLWYFYSRGLGMSYLAPIVDWTECDVWDYLIFSSEGWPVEKLYRLYHSGENLRFGCWMCTVVRQDRTMQKLTQRPELRHLTPLLKFRNWVVEVTSLSTNPDSRILRNGCPRGLTLRVRKRLFDRLMKLQTEVGMDLISEKEEMAIREQWARHEGRWLNVLEPSEQFCDSLQCATDEPATEQPTHLRIP